MAKNRDEPQKMTPTSEKKLLGGIYVKVAADVLVYALLTKNCDSKTKNNNILGSKLHFLTSAAPWSLAGQYQSHETGV